MLWLQFAETTQINSSNIMIANVSKQTRVNSAYIHMYKIQPNVMIANSPLHLAKSIVHIETVIFTQINSVKRQAMCDTYHGHVGKLTIIRRACAYICTGVAGFKAGQNRLTGFEAGSEVLNRVVTYTSIKSFNEMLFLPVLSIEFALSQQM